MRLVHARMWRTRRSHADVGAAGGQQARAGIVGHRPRGMLPTVYWWSVDTSMVMAYVVMAHAVMAHVVMALIVMAYVIMAHTVMVYKIMALIVMACVVMAYVVVAQ